MKHLQIGDGFDTVQGHSTNNKAVAVPKDTHLYYEEKFRSETKLIENSAKLHKQLSVLLGLSGNINNIAPGVEASFSKDIQFNQFHAYFVIVLDVEKCTKDLVLDDLKLNDAANKAAVENIKEFRTKYGDSFVQSVTYGKRFVAIVQIKDIEKAKELKRKFDGKVESQYAKTHLQIESAIQAIQDLSNANVFIYSAGSDTDAQDPQVKLNSEVAELNKLLGQFNKAQMPGSDKSQPENSNSSKSDSSNKSAEGKQNTDKTIPQNSKNTVTNLASAALDKLKPSGSKSTDTKSTPDKGGSKDDIKETQPKKDSAQANAALENIKLTLNLSVGGKDEEAAKSEKKPTEDKKEDSIGKYIPLRYGTKKYSDIASYANLKKMDIVVENANNLLSYIADGYRRINVYINAINYAYDNAHLLPFTKSQEDELNGIKKQLKILKSQLKQISASITKDIYNTNQILFNKYKTAIVNVFEQLNTLRCDLIKFKESAFLLGTVKSKKDRLNWDLFKLHFHRTSHHTLALNPPAGTKQLLFIAKTTNGAIVADDLKYNLRKNKFLLFSTNIYKKNSNMSYRDLPDPDFEPISEYLKSVYIADPKHANAEFKVFVYAVVGPRYEDLVIDDDLEFIEIPATLDFAANDDKLEHKKKAQIYNWYTDDAINVLINLKIEGLGGYAKDCQYRLVGKVNGKFPDEDKNEYSVFVTDAIDTEKKSFSSDYFIDKSSQIDNPLAEFLNKLLPNISKLATKNEKKCKAGIMKLLASSISENDGDDTLNKVYAELKALNFEPEAAKKRIEELRKGAANDIIDEMSSLLIQPGDQHIKILFPYNITKSHWLTGEIKIHKNRSDYNIEIFAHDPYGKGQMKDDDYKIIIAALEKRIKMIDKAAVFNSKNLESPYTRRQAEEDANSCGVIVVEDMFKRIEGTTLSLNVPYPANAIDLRKNHIQLIETLPKDNLSRINFLKHYYILDTAPAASVPTNTAHSTAVTPIHALSPVGTAANMQQFSSVFSRTTKGQMVQEALQGQQRQQAEKIADNLQSFKII